MKAVTIINFSAIGSRTAKLGALINRRANNLKPVLRPAHTNTANAR